MLVVVVASVVDAGIVDVGAVAEVGGVVDGVAATVVVVVDDSSGDEQLDATTSATTTSATTRGRPEGMIRLRGDILLVVDRCALGSQ